MAIRSLSLVKAERERVKQASRELLPSLMELVSGLDDFGERLASRAREEEVAKMAKDLLVALATSKMSPQEASKRAFDMARAFFDEKE